MKRYAIIGVTALALVGAGAAGAAGGPPWVDEILERVGLVEAENDQQDAHIADLERRIDYLEFRVLSKCKRVTPTLLHCRIDKGDYRISR